MSETTAEYKTKRDAKNTVILTEADGAINSKDFWGYAIHIEVVILNEDETINYALVACRDLQIGNISIFEFGTDCSLALDVLTELLQAIDNGDRIWDVYDYIPADD